jgi:bacteriocin-type transport-associated protein
MTEVLLKELTNSDIEWLTATGCRQVITAGTILAQKGQAPKSLHILLNGCLTVTVSGANNNPLTRAYAAMEGVETVSQEIARLTSGELVGEIPFVSVRAIASTVKALENSLVLSIQEQQLAVKLQQDIGFAARFYRAIAIMFSDRLQSLIDRFGRNNIAYSQPLRDVLFILGELHDSDIDWMMSCGIQQKIAADTVLIREGGAVDALYILLDGKMSLSVSEDKRNPLTRAFAAIEGNKILSRAIGRLSKGEIVGETPFIDSRLPAATVKTLEDSLVLSIPRQELAAKLQQDVGFASRFYRVIATLLSNRFQGMVSSLGYGKRVYSRGQSLDEAVEYEDELDLSVLDRMALAGKRFDWMQERLRVS